MDFSAHISYHYLDSQGGPDERVKNSLYGLGLPIIQGAISTILGVIGSHHASDCVLAVYWIRCIMSESVMHGWNNSE